MENNAKTGCLSASDTRTADQSKITKLSPRGRRLLEVLELRTECSRHDLDRLAGYENTPDGVMNLRRKFGLDIEMERRPFIDRDGRKVRVGYYWLTDKDREMLPAVLGRAS
jgi:hypothetical protein